MILTQRLNLITQKVASKEGINFIDSMKHGVYGSFIIDVVELFALLKSKRYRNESLRLKILKLFSGTGKKYH